MVTSAIGKFGLHTDHFVVGDESIKTGGKFKRSAFLNKYPQSLKLLTDFYYRSGHLRLTTMAGQQSGNVNDLYAKYFTDSGSHLSEKQDAFFHVFTAASLNHKRARFLMAFILENGLIPSRDVIEYATAESNTYNYLRYVVNPETSVLFKYQNRADDGKAYQQLAEFESDTKAQAISNLYLSSQVTSHKMLVEYMTSEEYKLQYLDSTFIDFQANDANLKKL